MADKISFDLLSPERLLLSAKADMVTVPGTEGYMGVMAGHSPLVSTLRAGMIDVQVDGKDDRYFIRGGFAEISPAKITVLAEEALPAEIGRRDRQVVVRREREIIRHLDAGAELVGDLRIGRPGDEELRHVVEQALGPGRIAELLGRLDHGRFA